MVFSDYWYKSLWNKKKILQAKNTPTVTYLNGCETDWNCHWLNSKIHHTNGKEKNLEHWKYIISSMSAFTSPTLQRSSALLLRPEADLIGCSGLDFILYLLRWILHTMDSAQFNHDYPFGWFALHSQQPTQFSTHHTCPASHSWTVQCCSNSSSFNSALNNISVTFSTFRVIIHIKILRYCKRGLAVRHGVNAEQDFCGTDLWL